MMIEYFYLDREGRELGSVMAHSFRDAHAWLSGEGITYHTVSTHQPRQKARWKRCTKWNA